MPWIVIGSTSVWPIVKRGLSDAYGFWNTTWMRFRIGSSSAFDSASRSRPSKIALPPAGPPLGSCRRSSVRPSVVLPEPDSPTTPSVWPARSLKVAPRTALNSLRPKTPLRIQKLFVMSVASMITRADGSFFLATPAPPRPAM